MRVRPYYMRLNPGSKRREPPRQESGALGTVTVCVFIFLVLVGCFTGI